MRGSLLQRYVLRELTGPFFAATAVLLALFYAMVLVRGVEFLLGSAAQPGDWMTLGVALLPMLLPQVLPIGFLLGVMIGFARLGEDGELTAFTAIGISPRELVRPALVLGLAVSAVLTATVFWWKPWGVARMRQTAREVIERNILGDLQPGTIRADLPGVVFHAQDVSPGPTWTRVLLIDEREPERPQVLFAPKATASLQSGVGLTFLDGVLVQRGADRDVTTTAFHDATMRFDVADSLNRRDTFRFGHEELSPLELLERAEAAESSGASGAAFRSAFHARLAQLATPVVMGLVATAVALGGRRRAARTAALLGFGLYLVSYVLGRVGVQLGEKAIFAPWVAGYGPVFLTLLVGIGLLVHASRRGLR